MESGNQALDKPRANIYKLLSACYYQPREDMEEWLELLGANLEVIDSQLANYAKTMTFEYKNHKNRLSALQVDYAKLFVGPFNLLAAPFGSVYLEKTWQVMGESTIDVFQRYREAGLEITEDFKEPPDHMAVELEFMYYLIFKHLETGDEDYFKRQQAFLSSHLGKWADSFTGLVRQHAQTDFYRYLASLTQKFVRSDLERLQAA